MRKTNFWRRVPRLGVSGIVLAIGGGAAGLVAQALPSPYPGITLGDIATPRPAAPSPGSLTGRSPSPFLGSVTQGEATDQEIALSLADVIDRGLRYNLGLIASDLDSRVAQAQRLRALSALLPQLDARLRHQTAEVSLVTFGFSFPGIPTIIGPFSYDDATFGLSQSVFNLEAIDSFRSARESERAARLSLQDARDTVVLGAGSAYFQVVSDAARVENAEAQATSSKALDELADHQVRSGVSPAIDSFRATVQRQTAEQRLAVARSVLEKDKLALARGIGLPLGQRFRVTSQVGYAPWSGPDQAEALRRAGQSRSDLKSAETALRAAELAWSAARAQRLPSLGVNAAYDRVGKSVRSTDGTYLLAAGISLPIFDGGRISADVAQAEATLARRKSELEDLKGRVDYEVRSAFLDLEAAQTSVAVAGKNIELAQKTIDQARDRFANGVTNNLEVVLAEEQLAAAHENYVASLFSHNFSKLSLLRAMGLAEQGVKQYLQGSTTGGKE